MIYKTRHFNRWARKVALSDEALCRAVSEIYRGLVDADLGGGIIKKRVALAGRGKRGSTRTLIATKALKKMHGLIFRITSWRP